MTPALRGQKQVDFQSSLASQLSQIGELLVEYEACPLLPLGVVCALVYSCGGQRVFSFHCEEGSGDGI